MYKASHVIRTILYSSSNRQCSLPAGGHSLGTCPCSQVISDRSISDRVYLAGLEAAEAGSCSAVPFISRSFSSARWRPFGGAREEPAGSDPVLLSNTEQWEETDYLHED